MLRGCHPGSRVKSANANLKLEALAVEEVDGETNPSLTRQTREKRWRFRPIFFFFSSLFSWCGIPMTAFSWLGHGT